MNFTSKSRYALKIMLDLATHADRAPIHRRDIARRQGIPTEYLDQIMMRLRGANLVASLRGRAGGYRLGKAATQISLFELFSAAEGHLEPVVCLTTHSPCEFDHNCSSKSAWQLISTKLNDTLRSITLQTIIEMADPQQEKLCLLAGIQECRPPQLHLVGKPAPQ